jgi:hypothetical protein
VTMRAGDWISLADLVVSVIGFGVVIKEQIRRSMGTVLSVRPRPVSPGSRRSADHPRPPRPVKSTPSAGVRRGW